MTSTRPHPFTTEAHELLRALVLGNEGPHVLADLRYTARVVEDLTRAAVADMRAGGASWSEIGLSLGTTRQGAQQRYGG